MIRMKMRQTKKQTNGKMRWASLLLALLLCVSALGFAACGNDSEGGNSETAGSGSSTTEGASSEDQVETVKISVDCETLLAVDPAKAAEFSKDGIILEEGEVTLKSGQTALDALRETGLDFVDAGGYISEINGLGAGIAGDMSGWLFIVNGEMPSLGADALEVKAGDVIQWRYSCDGGADIGFSWD
jgi:hypothetical protein